MALNLISKFNKLILNEQNHKLCHFTHLTHQNLSKHIFRHNFSSIKSLNHSKTRLIGLSCALMSCSAIGYSLWTESSYYDSISRLFTLKTAKMLDNKDDQQNSSKTFNFIADVVEKVSSAVVFIDIKGRHPFYNTIISVSSGSGFIVNSNGLILTNAHVVANQKKVTVKLYDGRKVEGIVEYVDETLDLATIQVNMKDLPFIKLGDSRKARPGEWVIAMGSPFSLTNTITVGVISTAHRGGHEIGLSSTEMEMDYIQTDAAVNIGNSGGPLINLDGEAIGINSMKVTAGISFAIPSTYAIKFLEQCEKYRSKSWFGARSSSPIPNRKRYVGITMLTLTQQLIEQFKSRELDFPNVTQGILIWKVVIGSPAHIEGLQPGDIITKINGKVASSANDVYAALDSDKPLRLTIRRKERELNLVIQPEIVD